MRGSCAVKDDAEVEVVTRLSPYIPLANVLPRSHPALHNNVEKTNK